MEQVSYGPPTCMYGPHMYDMIFQPACMVTSHVWSPHMYDMIFSGQLQKSPLHILTAPKDFSELLCTVIMQYQELSLFTVILNCSYLTISSHLLQKIFISAQGNCKIEAAYSVVLIQYRRVLEFTEVYKVKFSF